jgi:hypothetical protein
VCKRAHPEGHDFTEAVWSGQEPIEAFGKQLAAAAWFHGGPRDGGGVADLLLVGAVVLERAGGGADALLQLAADYRSDMQPLTTFWRE